MDLKIRIYYNKKIKHPQAYVGLALLHDLSLLPPILDYSNLHGPDLYTSLPLTWPTFDRGVPIMPSESKHTPVRSRRHNEIFLEIEYHICMGPASLDRKHGEHTGRACLNSINAWSGQ